MDADTPATPGPSASPLRRRTIARAVRSIWWASLLLLAIFVLFSGFRQVRDATDGAQPLGILAAFLLLLGQLWPSSLLWSSAIGRLGAAHGPAAPLRRRDVFSAAARSLPARYLPGSVWYAASRAALLAREHAIDPTVLAATAVLELALTLIGAIGLGAAGLLLGGRAVLSPVLLAVAALVATVAITPPLLNRIMAAIARRRATTAPRLGWSDLAPLFGWVLLHWAWSTASFLLYLRAFPALSQAPLVTLAGAFLVSWAIGFLTILAPQGAGIFEVTLAVLLASAAATGVATPTAAVIIAGHRGLVLVRDVVLAGGITLARRRRPPAPA